MAQKPIRTQFEINASLRKATGLGWITTVRTIGSDVNPNWGLGPIQEIPDEQTETLLRNIVIDMQRSFDMAESEHLAPSHGARNL